MYERIFTLHAKLLKALAHPRRLEIVQLLRDQELSVSEIYEMLDLPQANVSQHLMILRDSKVLVTRKKGKHIYYRIKDSKFSDALDIFRDMLIENHKNGPMADELTLTMSELVPVVHDPVCKMRVSPKTASYAYKFKGEIYYFCASGCYQSFKKMPIKYVRE